jgi:hypothetical protein
LSDAIAIVPLKFFYNKGVMLRAEMEVYLPLSVLGVVAKVKVRFTPAAPIPDKMATDKRPPLYDDCDAEFLGGNHPLLTVRVA